MKTFLVFLLMLVVMFVVPAFADDTIQADSVFIQNSLPVYVNGEKVMPQNGGHTLSLSKADGFKIDGVVCQGYKEEEVIQWGKEVVANNFNFLVKKYEIVAMWLEAGSLVMVGQTYLECIPPEDAEQAQMELSQIKAMTLSFAMCGPDTIWQPFVLAGKHKLVPSAISDFRAHRK